MTTRRRFIAFGLGALAGLGPVPALARGRVLQAVRQPRFVEPLPDLLAPGYVFRPTEGGGSHYEIHAAQTRVATGIVDARTGRPLLTTLWGYGAAGQAITSPGRSFVARRGQPITVAWSNRLKDAAGAPLPHLLPVDRTLAWADPRGSDAARTPAGGVPLVTHRHGGDQDPASDGLPDQWASPDDRLTGPMPRAAVQRYDNTQEAALLWYHDHTFGLTRLNVQAGLAGLYVIRDENEDELQRRGELPGPEHEVALVLQDRAFSADGELHYPATAPGVELAPSHLPEFFGEVILVNGRAWPALAVEPRPYRLRLLNGADSRVFELRLTGRHAFHVVGGDLGLLDAPVRMSSLVLAPGERADVVVDFSPLRGRTVVLANRARTPYPGDEDAPRPDPRSAGALMAFRVGRERGTAPPSALPSDLRPVHGPLPAIDRAAVRRTRRLLLLEGKDRYGRLQAMLGVIAPGRPEDGTLAYADPITENPGVGDTEIWEFYNASADAHPIHLHLVGFRILDRQRFSASVRPKPMPGGGEGGLLRDIRLQGRTRPPAPHERGVKDTALAMPGEVLRIAATFPRPGTYVWHCHILSHEDHEMMRPYRVGP